MSNLPSDAPPSFWRKLVSSSIKVDAAAKAAGAVLGLGDEQQAFEMPWSSSASPKLR